VVLLSTFDSLEVQGGSHDRVAHHTDAALRDDECWFLQWMSGAEQGFD
jgi:hypothetical protein